MPKSLSRVLAAGIIQGLFISLIMFAVRYNEHLREWAYLEVYFVLNIVAFIFSLVTINLLVKPLKGKLRMVIALLSVFLNTVVLFLLISISLVTPVIVDTKCNEIFFQQKRSNVTNLIYSPNKDNFWLLARAEPKDILSVDTIEVVRENRGEEDMLRDTELIEKCFPNKTII